MDTYKILVIGDLHGHDTWKSICEKEKDANQVIFLGDYFDSFTIQPEEQEKNFIEILEFKHKHPNCVLLLGNHDFHYIYDNAEYSGYNRFTEKLAYPLLEKAIHDKDLNIIYVKDNIIFSHAGITEFWLKEIAGLDNIDEINFDMPLSVLDWNALYGFNPYGDTISNGPLWVRPKSLNDNKLKGYIQVVGHTPSRKIIEHDGIWICDALPNEYLTIVNKEFKINDNR